MKHCIFVLLVLGGGGDFGDGSCGGGAVGDCFVGGGCCGGRCHGGGGSVSKICNHAITQLCKIFANLLIIS